MKVKLLKKLRDKVKVRYSREHEIINTKTREEIEGRFCVYNPLNDTKYFYSTLEGALENRRVIILKLLDNFKDKNRSYIYKEIDIYKNSHRKWKNNKLNKS